MAEIADKKRKQREDKYVLRGLVRDSKTKKGLFGYAVSAYDIDRRNEKDLLGRGFTQLNGEFLLRYTSKDFIKSIQEEKYEGGPDIVVEVANRFGRVVKITDPLIDAGRFEEICIDVKVRKEDQRPEGPKILDPFKVLKTSYKSEIDALKKAGIKDRQALFKADLSKLARKSQFPVERLEAFRLHSEMTHAENFAPEAAIAFVTNAGIKTRERLAMARPNHLMRAIRKTQEDGFIDSQPEFSASVVYGWIGYAKGGDPNAFAGEINIRKVLKASKKITEKVISINPGACIVDSAGLLNSFARMSAMAHMRSLMEEAGVTDLSSLGTFQIEGNRVIHPGFYVASPRFAGILMGTYFDLASVLIKRASRFKRIERFPDCFYFKTNPVTDAVIIGSVVDFVEDGRLIIGEDVTSLTIITEEILYSEVNEITYENSNRIPPLQPPRRPSQAPTLDPINNTYIYSPGDGNNGRNGGDGGDGMDGLNGTNGDVLGPAPNVTIYVLETPEGLPDINLGGRRGGAGGPGQDGGDGADGAKGRPADSGVCRCHRGVGRGGNGGQGGNGGNGGIGGTGGSGGTLAIHTLDENVDLLFSRAEHFIDISGGEGGPGGERGRGGERGDGGAPGEDEGWCDENPTLAGTDGRRGEDGETGDSGSRGQDGSFSIQGISLSDWNATFNLPYIVRLEPWAGHCLEAIHVSARNITEDTQVIFDGSAITTFNIDVENETLDFTVPDGQEGGLYSVVLRTLGTTGYVYSNTIHFRVIPHLASISPDGGLPSEMVTMEGTGFAPGATVRFADTSYPATYLSSTELIFNVPNYEEIALDPGLIDIQVVNPDGRESEVLTFDLTLDIIVRVKTWRVFPDDTGVFGSIGDEPGPERSEEDIRHLFLDDPTPRQIWIDHHIALEFDPDIGTAVVPAHYADCWPRLDRELMLDAHLYLLDYYEDGAINIYFVDDFDNSAIGARVPVESGGNTYIHVVFKDTPRFSDSEEAHGIAHEIGHVFGLPHVCGDEEDVTFGRGCLESDQHYLMFPFGGPDYLDGNALTEEEVLSARMNAREWHNP